MPVSGQDPRLQFLLEYLSRYRKPGSPSPNQIPPHAEEDMGNIIKPEWQESPPPQEGPTTPIWREEEQPPFGFNRPNIAPSQRPMIPQGETRPSMMNQQTRPPQRIDAPRFEGRPIPRSPGQLTEENFMAEGGVFNPYQKQAPVTEHPEAPGRTGEFNPETKGVDWDTTPPIDKPAGRPADPESRKDKQRIQEAGTDSTGGLSQSTAKAAIMKAMEGAKSNKKGFLEGMQDIAEGLGSWKASVPADYILTKGPPEQPFNVAEGTRAEIADMDDTEAGERMLEMLRKAGVRVPENMRGMKGSEIQKIMPYLSQMQRSQAKSDETRDKEVRNKIYEFQQKWTSDTYVRGLKEGRAAAQKALSAFQGSSTQEQKLAMATLIRAAGDKHLNKTDIQRMESRYGAWQTVEDLASKIANGKFSEDMKAEMAGVASRMAQSIQREFENEAKNRAAPLQKWLRDEQGRDYKAEDLLEYLPTGASGDLMTSGEEKVIFEYEGEDGLETEEVTRAEAEELLREAQKEGKNARIRATK